MTVLDENSQHRHFRFSLRTLLIVVMLTSAGLGWFGMKVRQAHRQRERVESLGILGVAVVYDHELDAEGMLQNSRVPRSLQKLLGVDFFANVQGLEAWWPGLQPTDSDLARADEFYHLRELHFKNSCLTDRGLRHLQGLTELRVVDFNNVGVPGVYMEMRHYEPWERDMPTARNLFITDAGMVHFEELSHLEDLGLSGTDVGDEGIARLQKLTNLKSLDLSRTKVTSAGLSQLASSEKLEYLDLSGTQIDDAGLIHLAAIPSLRVVILRETKVTTTGCDVLRKKLPAVKIVP